MTSQKHINFVVPGDDPPQIQGSSHLERLKLYGNVVLYTDRPTSMQEQMRRVKDAHIILNTRGIVKWYRKTLKKLPNLRMIATCSIGTNMIDLRAASEQGIVVSNQPGKTAPIVAEHIIGLMFAVSKRAGFQTSELKAGRWTTMQNTFLQGKTLGIIGTGNIGKEVTRLARAIGMNIIAWTFNPSAERATALGVRYMELDQLLEQSDVVSIQVRFSEDSDRMIGTRELSMMKKNSIFINCGRAELVDTTALVQALNSGHLAGAGLDVYDTEPLPPDHPLLLCEQVILTPHAADQTPEGIESLNEGIVTNVLAFLEGRPQNVVL